MIINMPLNLLVYFAAAISIDVADWELRAAINKFSSWMYCF